MKLTSFFSLKKPETTDPVNVDDLNDNFDKIDEKLHKIEENTGDMSNGKVFATIAESRESIASGDTVGTIVSKLMRWLKDLKGAAWKDVANNDTTGADGYVADARIVKAHGDEIDEINGKVGGMYFGVNADGKGGYRTSKNGTFVPFRNPTGNADVTDVLSGKTFSSATKENATGAIPVRGAWTGATTGNGNVAIPAGYHNGQGYVSGAGAYNKGVSDADGRVNTESASYKSGYTNGNNAGGSSFNREYTIVLSGGSVDGSDESNGGKGISIGITVKFNPYTGTVSCSGGASAGARCFSCLDGSKMFWTWSQNASARLG